MSIVFARCIDGKVVEYPVREHYIKNRGHKLSDYAKVLDGFVPQYDPAKYTLVDRTRQKGTYEPELDAVRKVYETIPLPKEQVLRNLIDVVAKERKAALDAKCTLKSDSSITCRCNDAKVSVLGTYIQLGRPVLWKSTEGSMKELNVSQLKELLETVMDHREQFYEREATVVSQLRLLDLEGLLKFDVPSTFY